MWLCTSITPWANALNAIAMHRKVTLILISFHTVLPATAGIDASGISQFL